jgi:membrane associated rhomboid family serine protease
MFGAEPDLVCAECADLVRRRYERRGPRLRVRPPVVSALAVAIAAALFVAAHLVRPAPAFLRWLPLGWGIWSGEVWRLLTSAFLHIGPLFGAGLGMGIVHILFNAWWLLDLGRAVEGGFGRSAAVCLLVGGAVFANAAEWIAGSNGVGLSGVVYAYAGFLFALRRHHPLAAAAMNPRTAQFLAVWFVVCIALTLTDTMAIGNWAHGAGALWGWLLGMAVKSRARAIALLGVLALAALSAFAAERVAFGKQADRRREWLEDQERSAPASVPPVQERGYG